MALPSREHILSEYDAYAQLENELTFVLGDLDAVLRALQKEPALPELLVRQIAKDMIDLKHTAERVERYYHFSMPLDAIKSLFTQFDPLSHATLGELVKKHDISHLQEALQAWALNGTIARWLQGPVYSLRRMSELLLKHMDELLRNADQQI